MNNQKKLITLGGALIVLWIIQVILAQAALAVRTIEDSPAWLVATLQASANVVGGLVAMAALIAVGLLALTYGRQLVAWLKSLVGDLFEQAPETPDGVTDETGQVKAVTRSLAQAVQDLDERGEDSAQLLIATETQATALVAIAKKLAEAATGYAERASSFNLALDAIAGGNPLEIARAAGQVKDNHIRNLLLMPYNHVDLAYWEATARLIATHMGGALRWQTEYSKMVVGLLAEIAAIKTGLQALEAHIDAAEAARPLLQARVGLEEAGRYLRLGSGEQVLPTRLFKPMSEYALKN